ncbi:MAG: hypothetical protein COT17_00030 [Elusimicrobia bacterium CG08_land_8_20_14_0_20_51_18]|nr:MAG: hypothetical protein COT17_00030 [Elusimicrobia bacterium CG08_land_8_20_14_0_20_51_18]
MKKISFLLMLAFTISGLRQAEAFKAASSTTGSLERLSDKLYSAIKERAGVKLAVMEFPYTDNRKSEGPLVIQERLTTVFAQKKNVSLIERGLLKKIMEELKLQRSGAVDQQKATELGIMLGADFLVLGTLNDLKDGKTEINSRIVEVKTGQIVSASSAVVEKTWKDVLNSGGGKDYADKALVQLAVLLDVSNSMDGLINQARGYIWKIVNELSASEKNGNSPMIEVALYEYGNGGLDREKGYLRQVTPFTMDLDKVSRELFNLKTNGGEEYCGWVIKEAVNGLKWSRKDDVYKAIFIAGNESFAQGASKVNFEEAVTLAKSKGIFVNTIFCGPRQQGVATKWKQGAELAEGDYSNIDQDARVIQIAAPQDDKIEELNARMNSNYVPYGSRGSQKLREKKEMDSMSMGAGKSVAAERAAYNALAPAAQVSQSEWDLVSAMETGKVKADAIDKEKLPEEMREMSREELKKYLDEKLRERESIKNEIISLQQARNKYISEMEKKEGQSNTLDKAIINSVRNQAKKKGYKFKEQK